MICAKNSILINRSVEDVYRFIALDFFENYQKWSPEVCELEQLTRGEMRVGVTGRQVRCDRGYRSEAYFRVTRLTPLRELHFASLSKPYFDVCYLFEPVATATRVIFDFKIKPPLVMLPLRNRMREIVHQGGQRVVNNLQLLLEAEADVSGVGRVLPNIRG